MEVNANKKNTELRNATRTAANYKKGGSTIPKTAAEQTEKAKEAKKIKEPAEKAKKPLADYEKLMDEMIAKTEELAKVAEKKGSTQVQAKEAFATVGKTCTACHDVFKKDGSEDRSETGLVRLDKTFQWSSTFGQAAKHPSTPKRVSGPTEVATYVIKSRPRSTGSRTIPIDHPDAPRWPGCRDDAGQGERPEQHPFGVQGRVVDASSLWTKMLRNFASSGRPT